MPQELEIHTHTSTLHRENIICIGSITSIIIIQQCVGIKEVDLHKIGKGKIQFQVFPIIFLLYGFMIGDTNDIRIYVIRTHRISLYIF